MTPRSPIISQPGPRAGIAWLAAIATGSTAIAGLNAIVHAPRSAPDKPVDSYRAIHLWHPDSTEPVPVGVFNQLVGPMADFEVGGPNLVSDWVLGSEAGLYLAEAIEANFRAALSDNPEIRNPDLAAWWNNNLTDGRISRASLELFQRQTLTAWSATPQIAGILPAEVQYLPIWKVGDLARQASRISVCLQVATGEAQFSIAMNRIADLGEGAFVTPQLRALGLAAYFGYAQMVNDINTALTQSRDAVTLLGGPSGAIPQLDLRTLARHAAQTSYLLGIVGDQRLAYFRQAARNERAAAATSTTPSTTLAR